MDIPDSKKQEIMDRVQRLTSALYRVTDLLHDYEPLKWTMRNRAVNIYNDFMRVLLPLTEKNGKGEAIENILSEISQISGVLELASIGTPLSSFNFEILRKEYVRLKLFIEGNKNDIAQEQRLLPEFPFQSPLFIDKKNEEKTETTESVKEVSISHNNNNHNGHSNGQSANGHSERQDKITAFLKKQGSQNISQIARLFPEISEKTVQRDLFELVENGQVKTKGEKRWRVYEIKP